MNFLFELLLQKMLETTTLHLKTSMHASCHSSGYSLCHSWCFSNLLCPISWYFSMFNRCCAYNRFSFMWLFEDSANFAILFKSVQFLLIIVIHIRSSVWSDNGANITIISILLLLLLLLLLQLLLLLLLYYFKYFKYIYIYMYQHLLNDSWLKHFT